MQFNTLTKCLVLTYLKTSVNREASSCNDCNRYTNISKKRHPFFCSDQRNGSAEHSLSGPYTSGNIFAELLVTKASMGKPDAFCNRYTVGVVTLCYTFL